MVSTRSVSSAFVVAAAASLIFALTLGIAHPACAQTRVVMLGTGTPVADPERSGPAVAIVIDEQAYLVDAGTGIVRRAADAAAEKNIAALRPAGLDIAFITHLHSDHTIGLPDLILSPWVLERTSPLRLFGPPGIARMTGHLEEAYVEDVRMRLYGLEPANPTGYRLKVMEIGAGLVYQDERVTVEAIPVPHGSWPKSFGFRFVSRDRVIVVSGDTTPSDVLIEAARGADVLLHEVYSVQGFNKRSPEWQRYHAAYHTSTVELAEIARQAQPKLLVLYHQLYWGTDDANLIAEIRAAGYQGEVISASDLDVY